MRYKICALSDTHGFHRKVKVPQCDVLIHAGDFTKHGNHIHDVLDFIRWMKEQPAKELILVPGNHDGFFETQRLPDYEKPSNLHILMHDWVELFGGRLKIFGSSWTPEFCNWYFAKSREQLIQDWRRDSKMIVDMYGHPDILVCHGPPKGMLDDVVDGNKIIAVGCEGLAEALPILKPRLALFGHIHEAIGQQVILGTTLCANVSVLDEQYRHVGRIFSIEI